MIRPVLMAAVLTACTGDDGSAIYVGNPGSDMTFARSTGFELSSAEADLTMKLHPCDGGEEVRITVSAGFEMPSGAWCSVYLLADSSVRVDATGPHNEAITLDLSLRFVSINLESPWEVPEEAPDYLLELGGPEWLAEITPYLSGEDLLIDDSHPLAGILITALRQGSAVYEDTDRDDEIDPIERAEAPLVIPTGSRRPLTVAITEDMTAIVSDDDGATWRNKTWIERDDGQPALSAGVATSGDRYVLVAGGSSRRIGYSLNGRDWFARAEEGPPLNAIDHGDGRFVAVGDEGAVAWSDDGIFFEDAVPAVTEPLLSVAYGANTWVAVGDAGVIVRSPDGIGWTEKSDGTGPGAGNTLFDVAWGGDVFVAVGDDGRRIRSTDGITWVGDLVQGSNLFSVTWDGFGFVAVGEGLVSTSPDGVLWQDWDGPQLDVVATAAGGNLVAATLTDLATSADPEAGLASWTTTRAGEVRIAGVWSFRE